MGYMRLSDLRRRISKAGTYSDHHKNWLFTIAQMKLPLVLVGAGAIAIIVTLITFLFHPVYEAKTIIVLDGDLNKIIKSSEISYPYVTAADYIRFEFFANHSVTLMHSPQLADQFVKHMNIKDSSGDLIFADYLIKPNLFRLIFSNDGQGIKAQWISDTQQFSISGYSKDPDKAVAYSRNYAESFLKENANNPGNALRIIVERLDGQIAEIRKQEESLDAQIQNVKKRYRVGSVEAEIQSLINKIYTIKSDLDSANLDEKAYKLRVDQLFKKSTDKETIKKYKMIMESNPTITTLKAKMEELIRTLAGYSVELTKEHPLYKATEKSLNATKESLEKEAKASFYLNTDVLTAMLKYDLNHTVYRCQVEHYNALLKAAENRQEELSAAQLELGKLMDEKKQLATLLATVLTSHSNVSNVMKKPLSFFRVVAPASIDKTNLKYYKHFPKRKQILALTFLASFFILSFLVIGRELYANKLYRGWQLSALKHPVHYAEMPMLAVSPVKQMREFDASVCKHIHKICLSTNDTQVLRVTSGVKGEGKASIARALAVYHQKMGKTVLLVDGDLTNRSSTNRFGFKDRPGLTDYIAGNKEIKDIIVDDPMYHIPFIPAGSRINPDQKPLNLKPLIELFTVLAKDFDKIIFIDEPTGSDHLLISDMIAQRGDILVVGSGRHSIYEIDNFAEIYEFMKEKSTLKGIIVNKIIA
ncbi:MAG: hypothetical protein ABFD63_13360 [Smithella sp.]